jgi:hypothetical protein
MFALSFLLSACFPGSCLNNRTVAEFYQSFADIVTFHFLQILHSFMVCSLPNRNSL